MGTKRQTTHFELGDEFARALAETTQSLVCVLDESGVVLLFNDACERATGFSRDEVRRAQPRRRLIPPEEAEAFREVLAFIWKSGHSSPQVGHWQTKDGGLRLIAWSNKLVPATADSPAYLVTAGLDLTDRPETHDEPALAGDPEAKLVEIGELAQEQRALRRVATLVASEASPESVFMAVSAECARVLGVNCVVGLALRGGRHGDGGRALQPRRDRQLPARRAPVRRTRPPRWDAPARPQRRRGSRTGAPPRASWQG